MAHHINGISFGIYNKHEVEKLSSLHIIKNSPWDALGHAVIGGLCDNALGPYKKGEMCTSCGQTYMQCNGHFGHISLPLPVFNPFLIKQLFQLLQLCCFSCHHLLFSSLSLETAMAQMEALNRGLDMIVDELEDMATYIVRDITNLDVFTMRAHLKEKLNQRIEEESRKMRGNTQSTKGKFVIQKQQDLFKLFMSGKLLKANKTCQNCNSRKLGIKVLNNALIIVNIPSGGKKPQKKKNNKNNEEEDEEKSDNENENDIMHVLKGKSYLTPIEARKHLRKLWELEKESLLRIFRFINIDFCNSSNNLEETSPIDVFFWETIIVPPNHFRPIHMLNGRQYDNEQTQSLTNVMVASEVLKTSLRDAKNKNVDNQNLPNTPIENESSSQSLLPNDKSKDVAKIHFAWQRLQLLCNRIYDKELDRLPDNKYSGVRQILEKKEGLFRKHMMGKRVNFAARSVISPDPYIMSDEIGVPLVFAKKLTYPQPVTDWNLAQLQQMVINGPDIHPGAISVQIEDGQLLRLKPNDSKQRKQIADRLGFQAYNTGPLRKIKIVNRHLISGDVLLLNRQPTLHKPSIMAHKARVLAKEKTLRLHYANCKCYNADFDGDEMNAHFPQSELARSEGYNIASVNFQYLVPKDGSPISGLIQDHIIAGVILTIRGQFFTKGDYQELLYSSLSFLKGPIQILPPAIIRPKLLWSGKQIISSLIHNIVPKNKPKPTFSNESKISPKLLQSRRQRKWTVGGTALQLKDMCDSQVIISDGELLCGIIDKVNLGSHANGLIHICYELYGGAVSTAMLTSLARLCTNFLQIHNGFTIGIEDILVEDKPNAKRTKFIDQSLSIGDSTAAQALGVTDYEDKESLLDSLKNAHTSKNPVYMKQLDKAVKSETDEINNKINEVCLPKGLMRQFPRNNLQMMIQAGAKGGSVNAIQISCLLGQIELEGRRVPLMMSGKTLPSFKPYDTSPRSGGFVSGRFLTGIGIQEFFFHCMAGREGLIDTAVKTSRSGYLQRCLIKHLESLIVNYDLTVRDSEGSVIQFLYGEDGIDILKSQLLNEKTLPIIIQNNKALCASKHEFEHLQRITDINLNNYIRTIEEWQHSNQFNTVNHSRNSGFLKYSNKLIKKKNISKEELINKWNNLKIIIKDKYKNACKPCPDPVISKFKPDINFGAVSEKIDAMLDKYIYGNSNDLLNNSGNSRSISSLEFTRTMHTCYLKSLCEPGEAVGLLAAQSIGEPSTQMTLNTFHFAGRGEMNVTLGIPRLREILMTASDKIATPSMEIPFLTDFDGDIVQEAERIRLRLNCVKLSDVMEYVDIVETIEIEEYARYRSFEIFFYFLPKSFYKHNFYTNPSFILKHMEIKFIRILLEAINRKIKILTRLHGLFDTSSNIRSSTKRKTNEDNSENPEDASNDVETPSVQPISDDEDNSSDEENGEIEGDTTTMRNMSRRRQELEYDGPEDNEIQVNDDSDIEEITNNFDDNETGSEIVNFDEQIFADSNDSNAFLQSNIRLSKRKLREAELMAQKTSRIRRVLNYSPSIVEYDFDTSKEEWCRLLVKFDLTNNKLDMASIVEEEVKKSYVHRVGAIERTFLVKDNSVAKRGANFDKMIKTEGVSFPDLFVYDSIFDLNRIYSNDMHAIAKTYGIEAAAKAIQLEIANVFAVYGIRIDSRHLSLVSDYMTVCGEIKGMNRQSMDGVSPIQAMTFETTTNFLKNATLMGSIDNLKSPSARIVVGRPSLVGTGIVETLCNPTLMTGTKPNQLFGGDIRKTMWKHKGTTKRKFLNNKSVLHSTILYKKLRLDK